MKPELTAPGERVLGAVSKDAYPGLAPNSIYRYHSFPEIDALVTVNTAGHEAPTRLQVKACAVVDSDLRSITPDWIQHLLDPVVSRGYQFVAPVYLRHKYDATITNNIVYNLTRALYGKIIRQPIGGDFALSTDVAKFYVDQDVWESDVARYGIDIWMTTNAVTQNFKICQSNLGVKINDAKDPAEHLGPMFRQVVWTIFSLMERFESHWKGIQGSEPVDLFGYESSAEPEQRQGSSQ